MKALDSPHKFIQIMSKMIKMPGEQLVPKLVAAENVDKLHKNV